MNDYLSKQLSLVTSPHSILGVASDASQDEIKTAYRRLAMRWHPDKCAGDSDAEEHFKLIKHAYSLLSDPERRQAYVSNEKFQISQIDEHTPWLQRAHNKRKVIVAGGVVSIAVLVTLIVFYLSYRDNRANSWQSHSNLPSLTVSPAGEDVSAEQTQIEDELKNKSEVLQPFLSLGGAIHVDDAPRLPSELPVEGAVLDVQVAKAFSKVTEQVAHQSAFESEQLEIKESAGKKMQVHVKSKDSVAVQLESRKSELIIEKVGRDVEQRVHLHTNLPLVASSSQFEPSEVRNAGIDVSSDVFNNVEAKDWYAAGMRFLEGRDGVGQNYEQAKRYLQYAAEQNHVGAQTLLGVMYAEGIGVPRDSKESLRWYDLVRQNSEQVH